MEIFGVGPLELLVIFMLALIFIGPGKMPEVAASIGKAMREFQRASAELTEALNVEIAAAQVEKNEKAAEALAAHDVVAEAEAVALAAENQPNLEPPSDAEIERVAQLVGPGGVEDSSSGAPDASATKEPQSAAESSQNSTLTDQGERFGLGALPTTLLAPTAGGSANGSAGGELAVRSLFAEISTNPEPAAESIGRKSDAASDRFGLGALPAALLVATLASGGQTYRVFDEIAQPRAAKLAAAELANQARMSQMGLASLPDVLLAPTRPGAEAVRIRSAFADVMALMAEV